MIPLQKPKTFMIFLFLSVADALASASNAEELVS